MNCFSRSSLARTWLFSLKALFSDVAPGAPAFMRTPAWSDKSLESGLASWAEMRHDTILYTKQSYTDADADADADGDADTDDDEVPFDYVEPQPEVYALLAAAARRLDAIAIQEDVLDGTGTVSSNYVDFFAGLLDRAAEVSVKELQGETLAQEDTTWIHWMGNSIDNFENSFLKSLGIFGANEEPDPDRLRTRIVADVHTFGAKEVVLEVGSGFLENVVVLHRHPNGQWGVAVGPAFSYHEFEQPMSDRMTDEEWRDLLMSDPDYGAPSWLD